MGYYALPEAMLVLLLMAALGVMMAVERGTNRQGRQYMRPWQGVVVGSSVALLCLALFVGGVVLLMRQH